MHTRPAITIVTPTRNRRMYLVRAIRSVQQQTLVDYEHIIVDDCSQDGTEAYVQGLADARIRYLRFERWRGANEARNAGVHAARSELLTFLDSDDAYLPNRLENVVAASQTSAAPDLLLSSFQMMKRDRARAAVNPDIFLSGPKLERALMSYGISIAGSSITVRRPLLLRAGGFAPAIRRLQDREMLLRLSRHCGVQLLSGVDWIKYPSADSISGPRDGYIRALGELFAMHPDLVERYRTLVGYLVARHVFGDMLRGRWRLAYKSLLANYRSRALGFSLKELWYGYRAGSRQRRELAAELRARVESPGKVTLECLHHPPREFATASIGRAA